MAVALRAGIAYFLIIFAAGAVLGTVRVLLLIPLLGELPALMLEIPVMLVLSWIVCARLVARGTGPAHPRALLEMGSVAFALLMAAETALAMLAFGRPLAAHLAHYGTAEGLAGLAGQICFALIPLVQGRLHGAD